MTLTPAQAAQRLSQMDEVLILTHVRPDGDTVGCAAALCRTLRQLGKSAHVLPNPELTAQYAPYLEGLAAPQDFCPRFVVSVDMAARGLFPQNALSWVESVDLAIDHHPSQEFFAKETCLDAGRAACGELMYDILTQMAPLAVPAATALYVAISTDCGCFAYGNTTPGTHRIAAELMELGIPTFQLNKRHFQTKTFGRLRLESMLTQSLELYDGGELAFALVSREMLSQPGITQDDAEDISSFVGQVEGVKAGATLRELEDGQCKISLRTDPNLLNASQVCALLGGGGHAGASGATVAGDLTQAKTALLRAIRQVQGREA